MGIIGFLLIVVLVGLIGWLATTYVPMPPAFKTALPVIALVLLILWLVLIVTGGVPDVPIPRAR